MNVVIVVQGFPHRPWFLAGGVLFGAVALLVTLFGIPAE